MESTQIAAAVLGWGDIAKIVLASGVVAALIGRLKDWVFKSRDQRKEAKFAAIEVVGKLDQYARESSRNVRRYREMSAQLDVHAPYQIGPRIPILNLKLVEIL